MLQYLKYIVALLFLAGILHSCEEETSWDLESSKRVLVVDALITDELKAHQISVTWSMQSLNETPEAVSGAKLEYNDGTNTYLFVEIDSLPGIYQSLPFRALAGQVNRLTLSYSSFKDTAFARMEGVTPLKEAQFIKYNRLYKYKDPGSSQPSMTEIYYNWSEVDTFCTYYGACTAMETFYTLKSIDINEEFGPPKQEIRFPKATKITRRKYGLSEAHQKFIRSLLIETEWRGGLFDVEQGNVPTNFRHGTRGWFATCALVSDTLEVE